MLLVNSDFSCQTFSLWRSNQSRRSSNNLNNLYFLSRGGLQTFFCMRSFMFFEYPIFFLHHRLQQVQDHPSGLPSLFSLQASPELISSTPVVHQAPAAAVQRSPVPTPLSDWGSLPLLNESHTALMFKKQKKKKEHTPILWTQTAAPTFLLIETQQICLNKFQLLGINSSRKSSLLWSNQNVNPLNNVSRSF